MTTRKSCHIQETQNNSVRFLRLHLHNYGVFEGPMTLCLTVSGFREKLLRREEARSFTDAKVPKLNTSKWSRWSE
ncbi:MAG: hypothetical protein BWX92_02905 [Deltaproteobacteria bacterium ADurb.Bin135]|nr:MAG: hypothetical protein BWX92_02905 [Deltaproteobacteria bacterium ADurb.Bin135]